MSRTLLLGMVTIVTLAFFPATLRADPIGFGTLSGSGGGHVVATQVRLTIAFGSVVQGTAIPAFGVVVGTADVGRTFSLSSGPEFEAAVRFLTDGVTGGLGLFVSFDLNDGFGGGSTAPEALVFFGDASGARGVDFAGFEITSLDFRLDELVLDSPGTNLSGDGIWTDYSVRSTLTVNGRPAVAAPVPEPATLCLMGLGLAGLFAGGRSRRRK